ncbi:AlbA family DNA-binding domain-containing protein [Pseudochryseolinea flava]|uniref:ATP-binding protein n=1 Tax=Pseudochryseolinea flava TaxID=2059302 RepID=A0A364XYN8_9BACT|nr:ATP-binding protein [Pseudochryseolinea flava]RAV99393.1 ATP-binding protein [Pseudochryseolinea flava]
MHFRKPQESAPFNPQQVQQLKKLVSQGESLTLEFKRKAAFPEKIVREIIALANTKGGILLIGIGDDKSIPGLKHPEDDSHVLQKALRQCRPAIVLHETFIPIGDARTVIQYEIPESQKKPHYFVDQEKQFSYVRVDDKSIQASREMREITKRSQHKKDIRFHYGDHERLLMQYLDEHASITLERFRQISGLKKFYASKKLVILVLADVLRITPTERGDVYSLAFKAKT